MASLTINVIGACGSIVFSQLLKNLTLLSTYLKGHVSGYFWFYQFEDDKHKMN